MSAASLKPNSVQPRPPPATHTLVLFQRESLRPPPTPEAGRLHLPSSCRTFSRKLLFLAALAREARAALHTFGVPSSWSSAQARNVWGRGWSWPSRLPCSFLTALACPGHCSSSARVTGRDRSGLRVCSACGRALRCRRFGRCRRAWRSSSQSRPVWSPRPSPDWLQRGLLECLGRLSSKGSNPSPSFKDAGQRSVPIMPSSDLCSVPSPAVFPSSQPHHGAGCGI